MGSKLRSCSYDCLEGECELGDLEAPGFYFGGELVLHFSGAPSVTLTWDQDAGWNDPFSIQARLDSAFIPGRLRPLDGSSVSLWAPLLGSKLRAVRVHGIRETPHVIELDFDAGSVLVADSHEGLPCDGDDLVIRPGSDLASWDQLKLLASIEDGQRRT